MSTPEERKHPAFDDHLLTILDALVATGEPMAPSVLDDCVAEIRRLRRLLETAEAVVRKLAGSPERIRAAVDEGMVYPEVAKLFTSYLAERSEGS